MTLAERIERDYYAAYKAKEKDRLEVLRSLKAAAKNRQVELRQQALLDDVEMLDIVGKQAKQRQESIEQFTAAGRKDLADKEAAELVIIKEYLPEPLSQETLEKAVDAAIAAAGATDMKGMGAVIQAVMVAHQGQVDGKVLSTLVRSRLS